MAAIEMQSATANNTWKSWTELTVHGIENLSGGRYDEGAHWLLEAGTKLPAEATFDPLHAASHTNVGAAYLLQGCDREAERSFENAEHTWLRVIDGIETLEIPATGGSSSFHFRLAAQSPDILISARRNHYRRLAEAALSIARFNRALIDHRNSSQSVIAEHAIALKRDLSDVLGNTSPEVRLLSSVSPMSSRNAYTIYADKLSNVTVRGKTLTAAFSDECAKLEIAIALTVLLAPSILIRNTNEKHSPTDTIRSSLNNV